MKYLLLTLFFLTPFLAHARGEKKPNISITFHIEGDMEQGNARVFPLETLGFTNYFERVPIIKSTHVQAFRPFPADDQNSYGIVFQLTATGAARLRNFSNASRGRILLIMLNGRPVDTLWIDRQINDGLVVMWKGASLTDIRLAELHMPRIGQDPKAWKKELKRKKSIKN